MPSNRGKTPFATLLFTKILPEKRFPSFFHARIGGNFQIELIESFLFEMGRFCLKILTVDDSTTMRRIISNTLKRIGYNDVVHAENGKEGLEKLAEGGVELVITDWNMPVMDGLEFVKNIRSGDYKDIPILMVTTNAAKEDIVEAIQAGVNNYVVKPFTPETLKEKIESLING